MVNPLERLVRLGERGGRGLGPWGWKVGVPPALAGGVWRWVQNVTVPSSLAEGLGDSWMAKSQG